MNRVAVAAVRTWPASAQWRYINPVSFRGRSRHSHRNVLLSRIKGATDKPPACPSTRRSTGTEVLVEGGQTDGRVGLFGLLRRGLGAVRGCGLVELRAEGTRTCSASRALCAFLLCKQRYRTAQSPLCQHTRPLETLEQRYRTAQSPLCQHIRPLCERIEIPQLWVAKSRSRAEEVRSRRARERRPAKGRSATDGNSSSLPTQALNRTVCARRRELRNAALWARNKGPYRTLVRS